MRDTQKTELALNHTNEVQEQYNEITNTIQKAFEHDIKFLSLITKTALMFEYSDKPDFSAYAYTEDPFSFDDQENKIVYSTYYLQNERGTIIHELTHLIVNHYLKELKNGAHCLEFAIINYCLLYRIRYNDYKLNKCFFKAYDIHEDKAYPNLSINPCKFDSLIKSIEWQTVEELCETATNLSKKIRKNLVV